MPISSNICDDCGRELQPDEAICPACGSTNIGSMPVGDNFSVPLRDIPTSAPPLVGVAGSSQITKIKEGISVPVDMQARVWLNRQGGLLTGVMSCPICHNENFEFPFKRNSTYKFACSKAQKEPRWFLIRIDWTKSFQLEVGNEEKISRLFEKHSSLY